MRLICPNCDAQYEVDDAVIPEGGRDVQCSNCGYTWFQQPAGAEGGEPGAAAEPAPAEPEEAEGAGAAREEAAEEAPEIAAADEKEPEAAAMEEEPEAAAVEEEPKTGPEAEAPEAPAEPEPAEEPAEEPEPPQRKPLDEAVLNVLREEAELETEARRSEGAAGLESQPDLGLESAGAAASGLEERMARLRGIPPERGAGAAGSRRDLLPDIEEINSTLRATSDRQDDGAAEEEGIIVENEELPRRRGSFGMGFGLVVLVAAVIVGLYIMAPNIVSLAPATEPVMVVYVAAIDSLRMAINGWVMAATEWLTSLAAGE